MAEVECWAVYADVADHFCELAPGHAEALHECGVCGLQWDDKGNLAYPSPGDDG